MASEGHGLNGPWTELPHYKAIDKVKQALNYLQEKLTDGLAINYYSDDGVVGLIDAFFDEEKEIADGNIASLEEKIKQLKKSKKVGISWLTNLCSLLEHYKNNENFCLGNENGNENGKVTKWLNRTQKAYREFNNNPTKEESELLKIGLLNCLPKEWQQKSWQGKQEEEKSWQGKQEEAVKNHEEESRLTDVCRQMALERLEAVECKCEITHSCPSKDECKCYLQCDCKSNKMLNAMWVLDSTEAFMSGEERKTKVSDFEDLAGFLSESEFYYRKETVKAPSFSGPVNQLCSNSIRKNKRQQVSADGIQRQSLTKANALNDMADSGLEKNPLADGSKGQKNVNLVGISSCCAKWHVIMLTKVYLP